MPDGSETTGTTGSEAATASILQTPDTRPYRQGVGLLVFNKQGQVFTGNRIDMPGENWQLPQGGIDKGETPLQAAYRELYEETGIAKDHVLLLHEAADWLSYDLPKNISQKIWKGRYRGQHQKWFAFQFLGADPMIDLTVHKQEFSAWRWADFTTLPSLATKFKKPVYQQLLSLFAEHIPSSEE